MSLRHVLEQRTHRFVVPRRLPKPFSDTRLYVSSEGGLRYLGPSLDKLAPDLLRLVSDYVRPGSVVWDIGANLGLFTFAAAATAGLGGSVLAVEPDPWLVNLLTVLDRSGGTDPTLPSTFFAPRRRTSWALLSSTSPSDRGRRTTSPDTGRRKPEAAASNISSRP